MYSRIATPFAAGWLPIAIVSGLYARRAMDARVSRRALIAWVPAWAIGLAGRHFVFGEGIPVSFDIVAFLVNGTLLVGWRTLAAKVLLREASPNHSL